MKQSIILAVMLLAFITSMAQPRPLWYKETKEQKENRMQWWCEARFGMFIHWGIYALPARHEWVRTYEKITDEDYQKYFDNFDPDMYNSKEWAAYAKKAGMKYMIITSKHHDGFCLWDTKYTDYKVTNTPVKRDVLKEMLDAFRAEGIRVGLYYSLIDWHHPDFTIDNIHPLSIREDKDELNKKRDMNRYREFMKNQLRELLTGYGQIDELFLDFSYPGENGKGRDDWDSESLLKLVRELSPHIIIDDRADLNDTNWGWDFRTPEQFMPQEWVTFRGEKVPWETCQTFSGSWGYYRDEYSWKSVHQLIVMLIETVSKGGNLLLNVGPTARGMFDYRTIERLEGIGEWMKYNSRSIYGCTQAPDGLKVPQNCLLTYNAQNNRLYIHVLEWPFKSLHLDGFSGKIKYAQLLYDGSEVRFREVAPGKDGEHTHETTREGSVMLNLPVQKPNTEIPVIEIILK
ncbi:MAG: alpha-L-fucosidase [Prevotellaceae bacterium]|jgi:alpha-L-fucosidase|nr:alpha-L-fucosidase [Prevotellaceae bacterium]